ncbi:MAG: hypothetical protein R2838_19995 [Caldilineaceae bacterium]
MIALPQLPDPGELLRRDGSNAASVLQQIDDSSLDRISSYLSRIVPGVASVEAKTLGAQKPLNFGRVSRGQQHPWRFLASSMSGWNPAALGVLLAIFQSNVRQRGQKPLLIGLEEPEMALHPAAGVLLAALREASTSDLGHQPQSRLAGQSGY